MLQDLRFACRGWLKNPGYAFAAIAALALGIGANTAIFTVVSGVLLRPLPFRNPDTLVQVNERQLRRADRIGFDGPVVYRHLEHWRGYSRLFDGMVTYSVSTRNLQSATDPERVATVSTERGLFRLLGVPAFLGRTFDDGDPKNVVVASSSFWRTHLGAEASAIGSKIILDGQPFTVIGVMHEGFHFPYVSPWTDLWIPWEPSTEFRPISNVRVDSVVGRLKESVSIQAAQQELTSLSATSEGGYEPRVTALKEVVTGSARKSLLVLLGAVGMVLLVACVNVANLLLARTAARTREIAIRVALGADRWRLLRQFLTESLMLAFVGGLVGLALGSQVSSILAKSAASHIPRFQEVGLDWRVFTFQFVVCVLAGIAFGVTPAILAARQRTDALKTANIRSVLRDGLVIAEVAVAFILLAGAGLLLRTFLNLQSLDPGFKADNVLTVHLVLRDGSQAMALEERVVLLPGVRGTGLTSMLPLQNSGWYGGMEIPGRSELVQVELRYITPGYFRAMGIPIRRGRTFSQSDTAATRRVIVINEALARQYFPNDDPIGRTTDRGTIIGVAGDVRQVKLGAPPKPEVYYSLAQNFAQLTRVGATLVVRAEGHPESLAAAIRTTVREGDPNQALFQIATMQQVVRESLSDPRLCSWLLGLFSLLATVLAAAGIYGVMAYAVTLRTREFGIRMALGADTTGLLGLVFRRGALLTALGLALGALGAAAITPVLRALLYGVAPTDPWTFGGTALLLAIVALCACLVPARRAAAVDPAVALRCE